MSIGHQVRRNFYRRWRAVHVEGYGSKEGWTLLRRDPAWRARKRKAREYRRKP